VGSEVNESNGWGKRKRRTENRLNLLRLRLLEQSVEKDDVLVETGQAVKVGVYRGDASSVLGRTEESEGTESRGGRQGKGIKRGELRNALEWEERTEPSMTQILPRGKLSLFVSASIRG
jgi:hypothetical protein